jgi:hypothetical protein
MAIIDGIDEALNTINVKLYENRLNRGEGRFIARVQTDKTLSIEEIAVSAVERGGATMNVQTLIEAYNTMTKEMMYQVLNGFAVRNDFFRYHVHVRGTYDSPHDPVEPAKCSFSFTPLQTMRQLLSKITVRIEGIASVEAYIVHVEDSTAGDIDSVLTPGGVLTIHGQKIKVEGDPDICGVEFVDETGSATKVTARLIENLPAKLIVPIPALATGVYRVRITTQFSHGSVLLKEPRSVTNHADLIVS